MQFSEEPRKKITENMVPMINVIFLLLIFFLMTSEIASPEPFEVNAPEIAEGLDAKGTAILFLSSDGEIAFEEKFGSDALVSFSKVEQGKIKVDTALPASELAKILRQLAEMGVSGVEVVTIKP